MSAPTTSPQPQAAAPQNKPLSDARLEANRANAQHSTGATTPEGKAKIRFNAVKNNLTGQHLLIREEDSPLYSQLVADFLSDLEPVGPRESSLVQSLTDIAWRLNRVPGLEMALLAKGQGELIAETPALLEPPNASRLELEVRLRYEKEFRNLALQESRLTRRRDRETAELLRLQTARKSLEPAALQQAAKAHLLARHENQPAPVPAGLGFAFSKSCWDRFMSLLTVSARRMFLEQAINEAAHRAQVAEMEEEEELAA